MNPCGEANVIHRPSVLEPKKIRKGMETVEGVDMQFDVSQNHADMAQ